MIKVSVAFDIFSALIRQERDLTRVHRPIDISKYLLCTYFLHIFVDLCIHNYLTKERPSVRLHSNVWIFKLVLKYKKVSCCWIILFFYTICFVLLEVQNQYQVSCEIINQIKSTFLSWCHIVIPQALDTYYTGFMPKQLIWAIYPY